MEPTIHQHPAGHPVGTEVCVLLREVFVGEGFTRATDAFEGATLSDRGTRWVATEDSGRVVGIVFLVDGASPFRQIATEGESEIHLLAVAPSHRRSGIADTLMQACLREVRDSGASRVVLSSQVTMRAAHALYVKHGFHRIPQRDWGRGDGRRYLAFGLELREPIE
ncbi:MAG TPA: GNAT family N-acetyltransferase [Anaeromyxobacteraceae bacterium]|nr:GNAT family N-acetyltransferase [Anaeromyxobacteraceae bacterium]